MTHTLKTIEGHDVHLIHQYPLESIPCIASTTKPAGVISSAHLITIVPLAKRGRGAVLLIKPN